MRPIVLNTVTVDEDEFFNTSMLWRDGEGAVDTYDKRNPVPFGEYIPDRGFWEPFAPELIGLIQRGYSPGTNPPVFDLGTAITGLAICFDVIYDELIWEGARDGAELYMFQTNNADFRGTDENQQQLAIARLRAIETGRSVVNISTVGTSQVIDPSGRTIDSLPLDEPGAMVTDVELRTGLTPSVVLGGSVPLIVVLGRASPRASSRAKARRIAGRAGHRTDARADAQTDPRLGADLLLAATGAQVAEALLEQLLELGTGATLEQHVPVGARDLLARTVDLDRLRVDEQHGRCTAVAALPGLGKLGLGREGHHRLATT